MKISCIIQARMNSKRLPGKIMMKINEKYMIDYLINRIKKIKSINEIIVSTSTNNKDTKLVDYCKKKNYKYFRGSEKNVLNRIYKTALKFNCEIIVFITADCPIIDYRIIRKTIKFYLKNSKKFDYVGNSFIRSYPDGMDVHVFPLKTLKKNKILVKSDLEKEHVTLGIKKRSNIFRIKNIIAEKNLFWPELGLTLDQIEDYNLIKKIILYFDKRDNHFFSCKEIISLVREKKRWVKINSNVVRKGDS